MKSNFVFLVLCVLSLQFKGQDTISVMAYNVLNYRSSNADKTRYNDLKTIISYVKPDAVLLNEVVDNTAAQLLLDSAFNLAGVGTYSRSLFINGTDTDNMLYYKASKIKLKSQKQIATVLRDISQYYVYSIISPGDTAWLYLHSVHLKAGSAITDVAQRDAEATTFCSAISTISPSSNIVIAGDFNFYNNSESAWVRLTSAACSHVFFDPINQSGAWNSNPVYKHIHTQSTRSSINPGCCNGATGGIDDRFDFILTNAALTNGLRKMKVLPTTYKALGNDGNHMNLSMISAPANTVVPANVAQALFNMSDHLPVFCKFLISSALTGIENNADDGSFKLFVTSDHFETQLRANVDVSDHYSISIYNRAGLLVFKKLIFLNKGTNEIEHVGMILENGLYIGMIEYQGFVSACILPVNK
jgi:endonuclease/exonuclease/phosphatase family metal-dependent hydrolase